MYKKGNRSTISVVLFGFVFVIVSAVVAVGVAVLHFLLSSFAALVLFVLPSLVCEMDEEGLQRAEERRHEVALDVVVSRPLQADQL